MSDAYSAAAAAPAQGTIEGNLGVLPAPETALPALATSADGLLGKGPCIDSEPPPGSGQDVEEHDECVEPMAPVAIAVACITKLFSSAARAWKSAIPLAACHAASSSLGHGLPPTGLLPNPLLAPNGGRGPPNERCKWPSNLAPETDKSLSTGN